MPLKPPEYNNIDLPILHLRFANLKTVGAKKERGRISLTYSYSLPATILFAILYVQSTKLNHI